jgi:hypothetical protein
LLLLNPTVFAFEILSPIIPIASEFEARPETPVNKELSKEGIS